MIRALCLKEMWLSIFISSLCRTCINTAQCEVQHFLSKSEHSLHFTLLDEKEDKHQKTTPFFTFWVLCLLWKCLNTEYRECNVWGGCLGSTRDVTHDFLPTEGRNTCWHLPFPSLAWRVSPSAAGYPHTATRTKKPTSSERESKEAASWLFLLTYLNYSAMNIWMLTH